MVLPYTDLKCIHNSKLNFFYVNTLEINCINFNKFNKFKINKIKNLKIRMSGS